MTSQYGAYSLHAGLARLRARMLMHTRTRPRARVPARTHARTHRPTSYTYCFSTATMITLQLRTLLLSFIILLTASTLHKRPRSIPYPQVALHAMFVNQLTYHLQTSNKKRRTRRNRILTDPTRNVKITIKKRCVQNSEMSQEMEQKGCMNPPQAC